LCHQTVICCQNQAAGAVVAESLLFFFLEDAEGFAGEIWAKSLKEIE